MWCSWSPDYFEKNNDCKIPIKTIGELEKGAVDIVHCQLDVKLAVHAVS